MFLLKKIKHVFYNYGLVFLWQRCNTLCSSGCVDDIIFSCCSVTLPQQSRCNAVYVLHLCCVVLLLSCPRLRQVLRLDEYFVRGVLGRSM